MAETPQPTPKDGSLRDLGISFLVLIGGLGGLLYYSQQTLTVTHPRAVTLLWDNAANVPGSFTTEVWASTNLTAWQLKTNVTATNRVTLPADKAREFFKIRNKGTNGLSSDWSRKPTL